MYKKLPCIRVDGEKCEKGQHEVIEEAPLALFVNGRHAMTAMMSPVQLEDFVTGYLYTEQIIKNVDEIESIRIEKNRMSVITKNLFKVLGPKKTILSGCGGSTSFIDTEKLPKITSDYTISTADIRDAAKAVLNSELHLKTGGIHIVALLDKAEDPRGLRGYRAAQCARPRHRVRAPQQDRSLEDLGHRLRADLVRDGAGSA